MKAPESQSHRRSGFTLVELLLVISVIAIMGALAISHFSNASQDSRRVVARQQQAALQTAVNAWTSMMLSGLSSYNVNTVGQVREVYNNDGATPRTSRQRLDLVKGYLDDTTFEHFTDNTADDTKLQTASMIHLGYWLELPTWAANSYPKVDKQP